ncbi:unnamed protein product [Brassica rapa subsp. trilocularis]
MLWGRSLMPRTLTVEFIAAPPTTLLPYRRHWRAEFLQRQNETGGGRSKISMVEKPWSRQCGHTGTEGDA